MVWLLSVEEAAAAAIAVGASNCGISTAAAAAAAGSTAAAAAAGDSGEFSLVYHDTFSPCVLGTLTRAICLAEV